MKVAAVPGLSRADAISLNERSHLFDGIERIEGDGTVVFCESSAQIMQRELGYQCRPMPPGESRDRALELISRFRDYCRKVGVRLP
ncbi:MAG: hypothetical protein ACE5JL_16565 [Dehalococcoidia bacterium]